MKSANYQIRKESTQGNNHGGRNPSLATAGSRESECDRQYASVDMSSAKQEGDKVLLSFRCDDEVVSTCRCCRASEWKVDAIEELAATSGLSARSHRSNASIPPRVRRVLPVALATFPRGVLQKKKKAEPYWEAPSVLRNGSGKKTRSGRASKHGWRPKERRVLSACH